MNIGSECDESTAFPKEQYDLCIEIEEQTRSTLQDLHSVCEEEIQGDTQKPATTSNKTNFSLVGKARSSTKLQG